MNDEQQATQPRIQVPRWSFEKLQELRYEHRSNGASTLAGVTMPGGYWVEQFIVQSAWKCFWRAFPNLDMKRKHTAESLTGDPHWDQRSRGERLKVGRCFKCFAVNGVLPITLANPGKHGPRKYFLQQEASAAPTVH